MPDVALRLGCPARIEADHHTAELNGEAVGCLSRTCHSAPRRKGAIPRSFFHIRKGDVFDKDSGGREIAATEV